MLLTCRCAYGINLLNGGRPHWGKLSPTSRLCQDGMNTIWVSGALYVHKGLATPISVVLKVTIYDCSKLAHAYMTMLLNSW